MTEQFYYTNDGVEKIWAVEAMTARVILQRDTPGNWYKMSMPRMHISTLPSTARFVSHSVLVDLMMPKGFWQVKHIGYYFAFGGITPMYRPFTIPIHTGEYLYRQAALDSIHWDPRVVPHSELVPESPTATLYGQWSVDSSNENIYSVEWVEFQ